ncbi:hypothetical protein [Pedobacter ghigonis]|uniref:hypothetical protein n=1 Tax=Pedobacter ghigonis TaxID=2730403 RepID=UPI00158EDA36|nr:hypothetical protein [Pedobacter ghigonis]
MLSIKLKVLPFLSRKVIWYSDKPTPWNCLTTIYKQSHYHKPLFGFKKELFHTKIIDLTENISDIQNAFDKNTNYEIRRALKDGVTTSVGEDIEAFLLFYNKFSETKKLPKLKYQNLKSYNSNLLITKATYDNVDIVMHSYVIDKHSKRARLLHSSSLFRNEDGTNIRAIIGRANRLLHFADIQYFKEVGFVTYDLGGYATDIQDQALANINQFKSSFGGQLKKENDYIPYLMVLLSKLL